MEVLLWCFTGKRLMFTRTSQQHQVGEGSHSSAALLEAPKPPVFMCEGGDDVYEPIRLF